MMGIGFWEMVVIAGVALIVIGPDRFPEFAKIVMRTIRDLRSYVDEVKDDVAKELRPVRKELSDLSRYRPEDYLGEVTRAMGETLSDTRKAVEGEGKAADKAEEVPPLPYPEEEDKPQDSGRD
jgi:sec-independent protein translocase protein TatB